MKYIDADKLIAEIERHKQGAAIARFDNAGENADYFQGKVDLCDDLTHIITSLQQEQEQAEKDLALTWEDIQLIVQLNEEVMAEAGGTPKDYGEDVLRRFNELKNKQ